MEDYIIGSYYLYIFIIHINIFQFNFFFELIIKKQYSKNNYFKKYSFKTKKQFLIISSINNIIRS